MRRWQLYLICAVSFTIAGGLIGSSVTTKDDPQAAGLLGFRGGAGVAGVIAFFVLYLTLLEADRLKLREKLGGIVWITRCPACRRRNDTSA